MKTVQEISECLPDVVGEASRIIRESVGNHAFVVLVVGDNGLAIAANHKDLSTMANIRDLVDAGSQMEHEVNLGNVLQ